MSNARFAGWPIVALCAAVMAALPWAALAGPRLVCEKDVFDFGERSSVETVQHTFRLENRGDADLRIERIRACCGATAALSATVLAPGGSAELEVNFSLRGEL